MSPVRDGQSDLQPAAFVVLLVLSLMPSCSGQHQVIAPSQPIVAAVGDDIILPCHLDPAVNVFDKTLEWTRPDLDRRFVFVWRDGVELEAKKHPSYRGRTSLSPDELRRGNMSLKLSSVKVSDRGRYRCFSPEFGESAVHLFVGAASSPDVQMTKNTSGPVLHCESRGWYPEPEVSWLDSEGHVLSAGPPETVRGPDGLYTVSSRVTVEKRHGNRFTCRVHQKTINQTRETQIHVPDDVFTDSSSSGSSAPIIVGSVLVVLFVFAVLLFFVVWKWRRDRIGDKKDQEDEESQRNKPEQEYLLRTDRGQVTAERQAANEDREETPNQLMDGQGTKQETANEDREETGPQQRQSNSVQRAEDEGTQSQILGDRGRKTEETQHGLYESQPETETRPTNGQGQTPNPPERDLNHKDDTKCEKTEALMDGQKTDKRQTGNKMLTKEEEETPNHLMDGQETKQETANEDREETGPQQRQSDSVQRAENKQLTEERDKKKENLLNKLKTKEREERKGEDRLCRLQGQIKDKEKQINELKQQLEDVQRQREETERKMRSVNREEEDMETQKDEETMKHLERKKDELETELKKTETKLDQLKREETVTQKKKLKASEEKEEVMRQLEDMDKERHEKQPAETQSDSEDDL